MTVLLGIDPGRQGALALHEKGSGRVQTYDMPDTTVGLHDLIAGLPVIAFAVVEKPFYPRVIGINTAVKIAQAYGVLLGALAWRSIPVREVRPAEWKAALNLSSSKAASREQASRMFPDDAGQWSRVRDDGRAEAALLAFYGLRWAR
jgi:Holliday junction resolvasome RuvABC endonuclease subunit